MSTDQAPGTSCLQGGRYLVTGARSVTVLDNLVRGRRSNIATAPAVT